MEKRDGLWLESQTGKDVEFKDPSYQQVGELIVSLLINNKFFITRSTNNTFIWKVCF